MIKEVKIENYKSIETLELKLGRINVFIGENGCGKSNILEAIALCSAAVNNKLDNEFLTSRGIRVSPDPKFMRATFNCENANKEIKIVLLGDEDVKIECELQNDNKTPYSKWTDVSLKRQKPFFVRDVLLFISKEFPEAKVSQEEIESATSEVIDSVLNRIAETQKLSLLVGMLLKMRKVLLRGGSLEDFLVYSPENTSLRTFEKEGQILPLGIKGEGLFKLLKVISIENKQELNEIKKGLELISWFRDFQIPDHLYEGEQNIQIQDRYIDSKLKHFDQVSTNEGFLFLLFYFCLFVSKETPKFFAIDNIDASLNPKLCSELVKSLVQLAKKYEKQSIFTTHNPAVLDGLNLDDEEQRLFVIYRNKLGHTKATRIFKPETSKGKEPVRLSEAFLRGYIGGLPKNF